MLNKGNIIFLSLIILNIIIGFVNAIIESNNYDLKTIENIEKLNNRFYYEEQIVDFINDNYKDLKDEDYIIDKITIKVEIKKEELKVYIYDLDVFITFIIKDDKVNDYY